MRGKIRNYLTAALAALLAVSPLSGAGPWAGTAVSYGAVREDYNRDYPLEGYLNLTGLQTCGVIRYYEEGGQPVMERRIRQDGLFGLFNYFGLNEDLCTALYGQGVQTGTGERAADGDSLLVLAKTPLYQQVYESEAYKTERDGLAVAIRDYLNSYSWRTAGETERARRAALYIASRCTYDMDLYNRFVQGETVTAHPSFTAYGCLVEHRAVCEGMCIAYQLLARATGLNAFCAPDDADPSHMFVYVQADGSWYKVNLAVLNLPAEQIVNRCFETEADQEAARLLGAYQAWDAGQRETLGRTVFAPGTVTDISQGGWGRIY